MRLNRPGVGEQIVAHERTHNQTSSTGGRREDGEGFMGNLKEGRTYYLQRGQRTPGRAPFMKWGRFCPEREASSLKRLGRFFGEDTITTECGREGLLLREGEDEEKFLWGEEKSSFKGLDVIPEEDRKERLARDLRVMIRLAKAKDGGKRVRKGNNSRCFYKKERGRLKGDSQGERVCKWGEKM